MLPIPINSELQVTGGQYKRNTDVFFSWHLYAKFYKLYAYTLNIGTMNNDGFLLGFPLTDNAGIIN